MRRIAFGLALLLSAVGCGGSSASSTCDDFGNGLNNAKTKFSPCGTLPDFGFNKDTCIQSYNSPSCTDADKQKIHTAASCLNGLPTCTTQTISDWGNQLENCLTPLETIGC